MTTARKREREMDRKFYKDVKKQKEPGKAFDPESKMKGKETERKQAKEIRDKRLN